MLFSGLLFSVFLEYVNPGSFIPIVAASKIGTIVPLLVFSLALFQVRPVSNTKMFEHVNSKWLLFFLSLLSLSVLTADVTLYSFNVLKLVLGYLFWYVMIVKLVTDLRKIRMFFQVLVLSHVLLVILNSAIILQPEVRSYLQGAPFLGDGNDFALSACIVLPMCLFLVLEARTKVSKVTFLSAFGILVLAIIGTQSRGASLALIAVLLFLWWSSRRKALGVVLIAFVIISVASFAPDSYFQRMSTVANYQTEGSAMGRIVAWKTAIRMAKKYPVTGVSSGHFPVALGTEFRPPEFGEENLPWLTAHSAYFLILGELGIPGITFFLAILIGNYIRLHRLFRSARERSSDESISHARLFLMLNASLVAFGVGGAFLSVAYYPHIFVLCGLIVCATYMFEIKTDYYAAAE